MYAIDKEKFGAFVAQQRREKGMTQKELAEKLYVSDKAVSKWERGLSIPDVGLLVPLAEELGVSVTELLECRRIPKEEPLDSCQAEELVQKVIDMTREDRQGDRAKRGILLLLCVLVGCGELWLLTWAGIPWEEVTVSLGTMMFLMALLGLYFCLFARETLPKYYDENRITAYSDGIFRMNLPGVSFNNRNWPHILHAGRLWAMMGLTLSPVVFFLLRTFLPKVWSTAGLYIILFLTLGGLLIPMNITARKYEFAPEQPRPRQKGWRDWAWVLVVLAVVGISLLTSGLTGSFSTGSGLRLGWSERKSLDFWEASYVYYDGWRQQTVNWNGEAGVLYAEIRTESGTMDITVTDETGNALFFRENAGTDSFEIPISGTVTVHLSADGHKGGVALYWE